jgi:hypothetical protein
VFISLTFLPYYLNEQTLQQRAEYLEEKEPERAGERE